MKAKSLIEKFAVFGGFIAVLFEWSAILLFYFRAPIYFNGSYPLSFFSTLPETRAIYMVCYLIAPLSFFIFVKWHLSKHYKTPVTVFFLSMASFATLAVTTYEPSNEFNKLIHDSIARFFAITFLSGVYLLYKKNKDSNLKKISIFIIAVTAILSFLVRELEKTPYVLMLEIVAGLLCQYWTLLISYKAYLKHKKM